MMTISLPKGFTANGIHCGLKRKRKDLSVFFSKAKCRYAALYTKNAVKAAPVVLAIKEQKKSKYLKAVIVNSGNANCMTGSKGLKDAKTMVEKTAKTLRVKESEVMVSSTGVIGKPLKMTPILKGIPKVVSGLSENGLVCAAEGIMTTDRFYKISSRSLVIGGERISIVGVAKGAGMIHPNMATMLCYIFTDANISSKALNKALKKANDTSFNVITVDGDMSTNDTVIVMANGEAKNKEIKEKGKDFNVFEKALNEVSLDLAKMIVKDGEGASKLIEIEVSGAGNPKAAEKAARAIANSLLLKCAVHGGDPNWGRVASSIGASGVNFDPDKLDIILDGVMFLKKGKFTSPSRKKAAAVFKQKNVHIKVDLNKGKSSAKMYSCDISKKYITINSFYTT